MSFIVTGISQDGNIASLEAALAAAGLSLDHLDVLGPDDAGATVSDKGLIDTGILTGSGLESGTGVPGLTSSGVPGISDAPRRLTGGNGSLWERLSDLAIPDEEIDNYVEALEMGRSIAAYHGSATSVLGVEELFRESGLVKVKTF